MNTCGPCLINDINRYQVVPVPPEPEYHRYHQSLGLGIAFQLFFDGSICQIISGGLVFHVLLIERRVGNGDTGFIQCGDVGCCATGIRGRSIDFALDGSQHGIELIGKQAQGGASANTRIVRQRFCLANFGDLVEDLVDQVQLGGRNFLPLSQSLLYVATGS